MLTRSTDPATYETERTTLTSVSFVWICDRHDTDIDATFDQYAKAMHAEELPWSLIVINNGLGQEAAETISAKLKSEAIDAKLINFNVRTPESTILGVALRKTQGDAMVLLPSYPQSDPADIPRMMEKLHDGLDYVASRRTPRVDSTREQQKSKLFNMVTRWSTGIDLHDINSGLRIVRRGVIQSLPLYGDLHIYLPILAARQGFRVGEVDVRHLEQRPGVQGQGVAVYLRRALDLLTLFFLMRFTQKPFRFFGGIGTGLLCAGGGINLVLAIQKLIFHDTLADRPMLVLGTLLMVLGIQMFSLGLIGELIIFVNAGGVKDYHVENIYENESDEDY